MLFNEPHVADVPEASWYLPVDKRHEYRIYLLLYTIVCNRLFTGRSSTTIHPALQKLEH
jgi:hypothetical protein